jgi:hypothetical protein
MISGYLLDDAQEHDVRLQKKRESNRNIVKISNKDTDTIYGQ